MLHNHSTAKLLDMEPFEITKVEQNADQIVLHVEMKRRVQLSAM